MTDRLYSDLLDGTSRRYCFDLEGAPGGITNATPAMLTLGGLLGTVQEQISVFRTPATAALTLIGYGRDSGAVLQPNVATLTMSVLVPGLATSTTITNALPPDYTDLPDNAPTIAFIATISPATAGLVLNYLQPNVTQGGNIGYVSPSAATLTLTGYDANFPRYADVGSLTINGLAATLVTELAINPEVGSLTLEGLALTLEVPFTWIDEDPVTPSTWIDDPPA